MLNRCIYLFVSWHFTSKNHTTFFLLVSISLTRNIQLDFICLLFCAPLSRNTHHVFVCLLVSVLFDYAWYRCFHFTTPFHFSFNYYLHQLHIFIFVLVTIHLLSISFYLYIYLSQYMLTTLSCYTCTQLPARVSAILYYFYLSSLTIYYCTLLTTIGLYILIESLHSYPTEIY